MAKPLSMQLNNLAADIVDRVYDDEILTSHLKQHEVNDLKNKAQNNIERKLTSFMLTYQENLLKRSDDRI